MTGRGKAKRFCVGVGLAGLAVIASGAGAPAFGQNVDRCARLEGADKVACLRKWLAETQDALNRAEKAVDAIDSSAARPQPATAPPQLSSAESLGAEQAARRAGISSSSMEEERVAALIVSSERTHPNRLQIRLENGQVWRQVQGDTQFVELPGDEPIGAEIWRSGFGGYRMRVPSIGRVLKVERMR